MGSRCYLQSRSTRRGRSKKLLAGVGFSLLLQDLSSANSDFNCQTCPDAKRKQRNCHNREELSEVFVLKTGDKFESESRRSTVKTQTGWFQACPMSVITENTWSIIGLVRNTTDCDMNITNLPFPGSYLQQPKWYRDSVDIIRAENMKKRKTDSERVKPKPKKGK